LIRSKYKMMTEYEKEYSSRPLSINESKATLRNKILQNFYLKDLKRFKHENKLSCFLILNKQQQIERSIDLIKNSTGYAFEKPTSNSGK
jgi:hypothetical protein